VLALPLAALVSAAAANAGSKQQLYAVGKPVCKAPKNLLTAHQATCMALRREFVKAGTKGALPFTPAGGAIGAATMGPNFGLTPSDIVSAYHLSTSPTAGSSQTVALVDAFNDPNIESDLGIFDTNYGLPSCTKANGCLTVVSQTGSTSALPANDTTGWSVEESLDVEAVHGACPACRILLVEANSESNADLAAAENEAAALHATEISNSFGEPESETDSTFQSAFDHRGIVITAATGDDGYYSYDWLGIFGPADVNAPDIPSSYRTVVAVGGTSLYLGQNAARTSETVWNENGPQAFDEANLGIPLGATGGGCSTLFSGQGWQTHEAVYPLAGCSPSPAKRLVADISMVADPLTGFDIFDSYDCGSVECPSSPSWLTIGGTSLSSPLVAAAYALSGGAHGIPYPAVTLYGHPSSVYDVTVGANGICVG
jgi:subtilase family serine protease